MRSLEKLPPTLSVTEAGKLLGLSRSSAYRAAERGDLPTLQIAGRLHVPTARLLAMLGYRDDLFAPAEAATP